MSYHRNWRLAIAAGTTVAVLLSTTAWSVTYAQRVRFPTASLSASATQQDGGATSGTQSSIYQQTPAPSTYAPGTSAPTTSGTVAPNGISSGVVVPAPGVSPATGLPATSGVSPYPGAPAEAYPSPWAPLPGTPSAAATAPPGTGINYPAGQVPYYAPAGPGVAPAPGAVYQGATPPPPNWDPYAVPGQASPSVFPQGGIFPGVQGGDFYNTMIKFREATGFRYTWIAGDGEGELGVNDLELFSTFAFPFLSSTGAPLRVTPGFAFHWWNGPQSSPIPQSQDMPPVTYDAYLDAAWNPQITQVLGGELSFRIGVYSDFKRVRSDSIRLQGTGLLTLTLTPNWKIKGGVMYLDRVRVKMLPAGGAIWVDNPSDPSMEISFLFPNPRFAMRLPQRTTADVWWYVRGDYGGNTWTIKRTSGINAGAIELVDYNDVRVATGLEFYRLRGMRGYLEVGISFSRELVYEAGWTDKYKPDTTVFLGAGLAF